MTAHLGYTAQAPADKVLRRSVLVGQAQTLPLDQWTDGGFSTATASSSNTYSAAAFLNK